MCIAFLVSSGKIWMDIEPVLKLAAESSIAIVELVTFPLSMHWPIVSWADPVTAKRPEQTRKQLETHVPKIYWGEVWHFHLSTTVCDRTACITVRPPLSSD